MSRLAGLGVALVVGSVVIACGQAPEERVGGGSSAETLTTAERQRVFNAVVGFKAPPRDLLSSRLTEDRLVAAIGWLIDHGAPKLVISALNSDHHNDGPTLHNGGHCADLWSQDLAKVPDLIRLLNQNPYIVEVGLGGTWTSNRKLLTSKWYFNDNGQNHIHIGTILGSVRGGPSCLTSCANTSTAPIGGSSDTANPAQPPDPTDPIDAGTAETPVDPNNPPLPPTKPDPGAVMCNSFTLGISVPPGTCVQRADDSQWYVCDENQPDAWPLVSGPSDAQCIDCPQLPGSTCADPADTE